MSRKSKSKGGKTGENSAGAAFLRGFITTGLLAAFAARARPGTEAALSILRQAVQGGAALSAGTVAARALRTRNYGVALGSAMAGAAGVLATQRLLGRPTQETTKESRDGEEEA